MSSMLVDPDSVHITTRAASMALDNRLTPEQVVELIDYPDHVTTHPRNPDRVTHWAGGLVAKIALDPEGTRVVHELREATPLDIAERDEAQVTQEAP